MRAHTEKCVPMMRRWVHVPGRRLNALPSVQPRMRVARSTSRSGSPRRFLTRSSPSLAASPLLSSSLLLPPSPHTVSLSLSSSLHCARSPIRSVWNERWERNSILDGFAKSDSYSESGRSIASLWYATLSARFDGLPLLRLGTEVSKSVSRTNDSVNLSLKRSLAVYNVVNENTPRGVINSLGQLRCLKILSLSSN